MDENDFKRLVDASPAETQRRFEETAKRISAEMHQHLELDRRVRSLEGSHRALEEGFSDLLARVERLEGSTH